MCSSNDSSNDVNIAVVCFIIETLKQTLELLPSSYQHGLN